MKEDKLTTRYYKLERLVKWDKADQVNTMLMSDISPKKVALWCCDHGFQISEGKMFEYKNIVKEAYAKQITVDKLLGIGKPKQNPIMSQVLMADNAKQLVKSEIEVLDAMIQRGYGLLTMPTTDLKPGDVLKAIELKNKLTGGAHGGLTNYGLDQLRELEKAKMDVILEVIMKYLSPEQQEELFEGITVAERKFYETNAPELLDEYDDLIQEEMDDMNGEIVNEDDIIVDDDINIAEIRKMAKLPESAPFIPYCENCKKPIEPINNGDGNWKKVPTNCPECGKRTSIHVD